VQCGAKRCTGRLPCPGCGLWAAEGAPYTSARAAAASRRPRSSQAGGCWATGWSQGLRRTRSRATLRPWRSWTARAVRRGWGGWGGVRESGGVWGERAGQEPLPADGRDSRRGRPAGSGQGRCAVLVPGQRGGGASWRGCRGQAACASVGRLRAARRRGAVVPRGRRHLRSGHCGHAEAGHRHARAGLTGSGMYRHFFVKTYY
jgi:hypothetical protein